MHCARVCVCVHTSQVEMFDLDKDPHQLQNLAQKAPAAQKQALHDMLQKQWECRGASCT